MSDYKRLMSLANDMRAFSHVPYSNFRVGAVLVGKSGKEYTGCNVENAAFSPTICAERTAFAKAVSEGEKSLNVSRSSAEEAEKRHRFVLLAEFAVRLWQSFATTISK